MHIHQKQFIKAYNRKGKRHSLCVRGLVLKTAGHVHKGLDAFKFSRKWEGLYAIKETYDSCFFFFFGLLSLI